MSSDQILPPQIPFDLFNPYHYNLADGKVPKTITSEHMDWNLPPWFFIIKRAVTYPTCYWTMPDHRGSCFFHQTFGDFLFSECERCLLFGATAIMNSEHIKTKDDFLRAVQKYQDEMLIARSKTAEEITYFEYDFFGLFFYEHPIPVKISWYELHGRSFPKRFWMWWQYFFYCQVDFTAVDVIQLIPDNKNSINLDNIDLSLCGLIRRKCSKLLNKIKKIILKKKTKNIQ